MTLSAIGLPTDRKGNVAYGAAQDWMADNDLSPYMPQLRYGASYNLAAAYDSLTGGLGYRQDHPHGWTPAMIAETRRFEQPMVFDYGGYWFSTKPGALAWGGVSQDALTLEQVTGYLRQTLAWFGRQGIIDPWIMVDEPPHHPIYGWTQEVEDRVVKFVTAAVAAGWMVGVAEPGPTQLKFWQQRIRPGRWILHDKHTPAEYGPVAGEKWIYNASTFDGLAARLRAMGATGYLQWSGVRSTKGGPVPILFDANGAPTPSALRLLEELKLAEQPPVVPPVTPGEDERIATLEKQVIVLQARVATLEAVVTPPPAPEQPLDMALFYTDVLADWQRELPTLATYPTVVIQAEFATATATSAGQPYAGGRTPLAALEDSGVDVLLYVSPWWVWTASQASGPTQWLRAAQRAKLDAVGGWLLDRQGAKVQTFGGKMAVADARNRAYTDWLAEQLIALPGDKLFIDNAFWHQGAYHKWLVSDEVWGAAVCAFYARLRAAGKKLILNAGWEPAVGSQSLEGATWPLREFCDGVSIEIPAGFKSPPDWEWWSLYDYEPMNTVALEAVTLDWKRAGKDVYLIASGHRSEPPLKDETPFTTLAEHRAFWRTLASKLKVSVSAQVSTSDVPVLETMP